MKKSHLLYILLCTLFYSNSVGATTFHATNSNYKTFIPQLKPGDSLVLAPGVYIDRLKLIDIMGEEGNPIVIMGGGTVDDVVFVGNACCNTVSLTRCAWLKIENFTIDGKFIKYIDAVKAEGTTNSWTHDITLEGLKIIGHGNDQQTVGISTKCPSWNWVIRRNIIIEAGTGIYLGNSNGQGAFVNGLVEYNLIINTVGYNMQIKRQNDNTRIIPGMVQEGRTIIRYNVFSKAENSSSGSLARPNLLVGGFPPTTAGKDDHYEIYGNFLWQNPVEKLFQGTGNVSFYNNVLVNQYAGGGGIQIQHHNGHAPKDIYIFNNTLLTEGRSINFYKPDLKYEQRVEGNAIFTSKGINNAPLKTNNLTKTIAEASNYLVNPVFDIDEIDMNPIDAKLIGMVTPSDRYKELDRFDRDFDGLKKDWARLGAYSHSQSPQWKLALERRPEVEIVTTNQNDIEESFLPRLKVWPSLVMAGDEVNFMAPSGLNRVTIFNTVGDRIFSSDISRNNTWIVPGLTSGLYIIVVENEDWIRSGKLVVR